MAWLERMRAARIAGVGALMLVGVACSSDKPNNSDGDNGDDTSTDTDTASGKTDDAKDAGKMDAAKPPALDAKVDLPAADAGDADTALPKLPDGATLPPPTKPDAAVVNNSLTPLPHDGMIGSICYAKSDCTGDDLVCLLPAGSAIPGICVDDCDDDKDCREFGDVKGKCDALPLQTGTCFYPCGGPKGDGKGTCPQNMQCANFAPGNILFPDWRCRYPDGGGKKTEDPYAKCEVAHEGGDCEGLSWCAAPALSVSSAVFSHGYCSPLCTKDADCKGADEGTTAKASCDITNGTCIFDCSNAGARCPVGMNCLDINDSAAFATLRCIYID